MVIFNSYVKLPEGKDSDVESLVCIPLVWLANPLGWMRCPLKSRIKSLSKGSKKMPKSTENVKVTIFIWVNFITTSLFSLTIIIVSKGNHPQMAELFRSVKYCNLPRYS